MRGTTILVLTVISINMTFAGEITIETNDSLFRNDLFDEKRERAEEYKRSEQERDMNNQQWYNVLPVGCVLYQSQYFIYRCNQGQFYKGYNTESENKYRKLSETEISSLEKPKSNYK
ncbi:hypothetical protein N8878_04835 [Psychromonas sp.]|nr:hypothetical protein [Psychromonas sp.]